MKMSVHLFITAAVVGLTLPASLADEKNPPPPPNATARIVHYLKPTYPVRLSQAGVSSGEARIMFEIDEAGGLVDLLPVAYTHKAFAEAAMQAIRTWIFEPARLNGQPVGVIGTVTTHFETKGVMVSAKFAGETINELVDMAYQPCAPGKLDERPRLVRVVEPYYPRQFYVEGATGLVMVDFFIDEAGQVRMPMVKVATESFLGGVTVDALKQWRFEPPTSRGRPVLVHAAQDFSFHPRIEE